MHSRSGSLSSPSPQVTSNMHRRFSSFVKGSSSGKLESYQESEIDDTESKAETVVRDEPLPSPSLKVKRVDYYYSRWTKSWKYRVIHFEKN